MKCKSLMLFIVYSFLALSLTFLSACTEENEPFPVHEVPPIQDTSSALEELGFVKVNSHGKSTFVGSNKQGVRNSETPQMQVSFSYDYYIGKHEVSLGEYQSLRPNAGAECESECNDNSPVTNVTYYDAVLYANALSKSQKYDTAYTYTKASFDASGNCVNLSGLVFHENVVGFRLPTEAEWVYVAEQGWNADKGWNNENSGYAFHDVATSEPNDLGVYDMAGNVLEWVNDWLTYFKKDPVVNFAGGADGGSLGERVLKGGSYKNDPLQINVYSRGDIYTVTSSTKGSYLGFRLALGAIPNATWLDESGETKESVAKVSIETYDMKHLTGTFESKMVFLNNVTGNLSFVDFGTGLNSVVEIKDTLRAFHPDVSPDGKRVAFCTGMEGVSGPSSVYVRDLDAKGAGLVKLNVENAAIPRWRVLDNGDTVIVYVTDAGNNKEEAAFKAASTWQVPFSNGQFGIPQKLFDGAYHGGISDDNTLAVTGARLLRARVANSESTVTGNARDTVWYGGEQACNASLANDGSHRTLFLDFGGKTGREFVGKTYRTHERLLVMDSKGNLVQSVAAPNGYTFDHTEWVLGGSNYAIATLVNADGAHEKIVLVNFSDSTVKILAEGDELWHPCLWHSRHNYSSEKLDTDSAGVYYHSSAYYSALELRVKMQRFWERRDSVTAVALGSSRTMFGLNDKEINSHKLLNMGFSNAQMTGINYVFTNYVMNHLKKLKVLVLEFSPDFLWYDGNSTWTAVIYDKVPGYKYDENHNFWVDGLPEHFVDAVKVTPRTETALLHPYDLEDFLLPCYTWGDPYVQWDTTSRNLDSPIYQENFEIFHTIVERARAKGIKVVVTVFPQNPAYRSTGSFGIYGPRRSTAKDLIDSVQKLDVVFFDENKFGNHDYPDSMAYNLDHLGRAGAKQFTHRLDSLLMTLE